MHTNNGKAFVAVAIIPTLDVGQRVAAVIATERPELDQHNATAQDVQLERCRVDPFTSGKLRSSGRFGSFVFRRSAKRPAYDLRQTGGVAYRADNKDAGHNSD